MDGARYLPIQNISYDLGSTSMSGYFVQQSATCVVTLMISDKGDPEASPPPSPTRVRLALNPGQIAGVDSEEGRRRLRDMALGRFGRADEVAEAVIFLLSDASSLFLGQTLNPNAGGFMP